MAILCVTITVIKLVIDSIITERFSANQVYNFLRCFVMTYKGFTVNLVPSNYLSDYTNDLCTNKTLQKKHKKIFITLQSLLNIRWNYNSYKQFLDLLSVVISKRDTLCSSVLNISKYNILSNVTFQL